VRRRRARGAERTGDVSTPLLQPQPSLPLDRARPPDERLHRQLPQTAELVRQRLCWPMPSLERAIGVCRDEGERRNVGPSEGFDDESRSLTGKPSLATLLPRLNELPGACVVDDCGTGTREGQPPPAAFHTTPDRPGAGRATTGAERRRETNQRVATTGAERVPRPPASGAAIR
jgi:hypothetical protein